MGAVLRIEKRLLFLIIIVLTGILGTLILKPDTIFRKKTYTPPVVYTGNVLTVVDTQPVGEVATVGELVFDFNDEVDAHEFEHYFYISPEMPGSFQKDGKNRIVFTPTVPFEKGVYYSVKITPGLRSLSHRTLGTEYYTSFSIRPSGHEVRFRKDGFSGRVLSFPANIQTTLTLSEHTDFNATLYSTTTENLLNYLAYDRKEIKYDNYTTTNETYIRDYIINDLEQIRTYPVSPRTEELSFTLPAGVYYLEATDETGKQLGATFLLINKTGIAYRQDDKKITLGAFDLASGKNISERADVSFYHMESAPKLLTSRTFSEIESEIPMPYPNRVDLMLATVRNETILVPVRQPQSIADIQVTSDLDNDTQIFLYTDRPIYKPQDTVFFRGIVRRDGDSLYSLPPAGQQVRVWLGYGDNPKVDVTVTTDAQGVFSGNFIVPGLENVNPDYSYLTQFLYASTDVDKRSEQASAYFDVVAYKKPTFDLTVERDKDEYIRNDSVKFVATGKQFNGKPVVNQEIEYTIYAESYTEVERAVYNTNFNVSAQFGMCGGGFGAFEEYYGAEVGKGTVKLDGSGRAEISVDPKSLQAKYEYERSILDGSNKLTVVVKKRDTASGNDIVSAATTTVHAASINIFFLPSARNYKAGEDVISPFYAESLNGEKIANTEFAYKLVTTTYENDTTKEKIETSGKVMTDGNGKGIVAFTVPKAMKNQFAYLFIEGKDSRGNTSRNKKYLTIRDADDTQQSAYSYWERSDINQTYLKIVSSKNSFLVGDTIQFTITAPEDLDVLFSLERGRIYQPKIIHLKKGNNTVSVNVTDELSPSITAVFTYFQNGSYYSEGLSLNVPAMHKLLKIDLTPDKQKYTPQETAYLKILTRDLNNNPVPAQLSLGVVDKAIYGLRKNATSPIHSSFYYFRPRRTNASSSLTWIGFYEDGRGGGGGGGGGSLAGKTVDTLYWNPNVTTGANGETVVSIPLKDIKTTWKAQVYGSTTDSAVGQADTEFIVD
jgi:alpha-2-macroglobulin